MKAKDLDYVRGTIENEGFHYAFTGYSEFKEVDDPKFHELREAYLKAGRDLAAHLNVEFD